MDKRKIIMSLDDIMGDRFGRYSKYIIQDRALPDVRDGLKPVQRRILYAMYKEGNTANKPYRKSAKTVGNVIGNYHPHGDTSVYDAMVRLSQEWKMRIPLVDMQGNNGSIDNDPAAAMRYTEARLAPISMELLKDLDKETVPMTLNFDDTEYEPTVLPAKFPNLLVNGATGISAGYATDIPPHNLHEVIDATIYKIQHPRATFDDLHKFILGPDFPTGGIVEGKNDIAQALRTGKGKVIVRCQYDIKESKSINQIIISEIPYEVNKSDLVRKIDEIRFNKNVNGIIEVRDESDRQGLQIVIDLKKDVDIQNTLNYLFKNTDLQKNYHYNMVAIKDRKPTLMGIEDIITGYINHAREVILKRSQFELDKALKRKHIVDGLIKAISILDDVVKTIRASKDKSDAKKNLQDKFGFTEPQSEAIVTLQLYRLTNTDIVSLEQERDELLSKITYLKSIIENEKVLRKVIIDEMKQLKKDYPSPRLTKVNEDILDTTINEKAMILSEECYVSITQDGYIKKISTRSYKASVNTAFGKKDDDYLISLFEANTLDTLLVFTNKGRYCFIPVYKLEEFKWKDLGKHLSYLVKIDNDEKIVQSILVKDFDANKYIVIASKNGQIKKVLLSDFKVIRFSKPILCMKLKNDDEVVSVNLTDGKEGLLLISQKGYCLSISENEINVIGIKAAGVKGITLKDDELVSVNTFKPELIQSLVLFTNPSGVKRVRISDIPVGRRANKGTLLYKIPKTKAYLVYKTFVCDTKDTLIVYGQEIEKDISIKDINYTNFTQRPGKIKDYSYEDVLYVYQDKVLIVDKEKQTKKVTKVKEVIKEKPETPIQEEDIPETLVEVEEVKPVRKKKSQVFKPKKEEFETISFDEFLDLDDF